MPCRCWRIWTCPAFRPPIGKSTQEAMRSGIVWGCAGRCGTDPADECRRARRADVFCTGGDGIHLARLIDRDMKFDPNLVLGVWR